MLRSAKERERGLRTNVTNGMLVVWSKALELLVEGLEVLVGQSARDGSDGVKLSMNLAACDGEGKL